MGGISFNFLKVTNVRNSLIFVEKRDTRHDRQGQRYIIGKMTI